MNFRKHPLAVRIGQTLLTAFALGAMPVALAAAQDDSASASNRESAVTALDAVMVTAQSREQELQDVPIALQVVNEHLLDDVAAEEMGDIDSFVPGLSINSVQHTQPEITLRGISTEDFGIGTDPAVGVFIDGVYTGRSGGILLPFTDVERIEVLKGPQGTLFGRNTAAGAVSIITHRPDPGDTAGRARLRLGNDGKRYLDAMANIPTGERSALRFTGLTNDSDGWLRDAASGEELNGDDVWAGRLAWQVRLGDDTTAVLSWDHERLDQRGRPTTGVVPLPAFPALPPGAPDGSGFLDPRDIGTFNDTGASQEARTFDGATLSLEHEFEWGSLTSTTAWRQFDAINLVEEDGTNRPDLFLSSTNTEDNESVYQEFKFSGHTDTLDWVAGTSYYREDADQTSQIDTTTTTVDTAVVNFGLAPTPDGTLFDFFSQALAAQGIPLSLLDHAWNETFANTLNTTAYAGFGDVIWHVNDRLNLTFGARYTHDSKDFTWFNTPRTAPTLDATLDALEAGGFFEAAGVPRETFVFDLAFIDPPALTNKGRLVRRSSSWSDFSPRVVVDYHFDDDTMGFISLAKGYKAGGFNALQIDSEFDNESVWNAEAGIKQSFPEARLAYNASLFYFRYNDRQSVRLDATPSIPRFVVDTADQSAFGVDFDATWQVTEAFGVDVNAAYIDSTYKNYVVTTLEGTLNLDGEPTGEPTWSAAFGANYVWDVAGGDLRFALRHAYRGACRRNEVNALDHCARYSAFPVNSASNRTDARLVWTAPQGNWSFALYGNNLFDNQYVTQLNVYGRDAFGTVGAIVSDPRTYGLEIAAKF